VPSLVKIDSGEEVENVKVYRQMDTDNRQSEKLT
jgi:hypothetical protein